MKYIVLVLLNILSRIIFAFYSLVNRKLSFKMNGIALVNLKLNGSVNIVLNSGFILSSKIIVDGINNTFIFDDNVRISKCVFCIKGDNCLIDFRGSRLIQNTKFELLDSNTKLTVNNNTGFNGNRVVVAGTGNYIYIGSDCIIAEGAEIWSSDTHSVLDNKSGNRLNMDKPIIISDRVWIGNNSLILKGVSVGTDSIIAAGSVVTKNIENNTIVAGIPAITVRKDIRWDVKRL